MKPKNFPGRKNDRRKVALRSLRNRKDQDAANLEALTLHSRIMPDTVARGVRTKKDRSHKAKLRA